MQALVHSVTQDLTQLRAAEARATSQMELRSVRAQISAAEASLDELQQLQPLSQRRGRVTEATSPGYWLNAARSGGAGGGVGTLAAPPASAPKGGRDDWQYATAASTAQKVESPWSSAPQSQQRPYAPYDMQRERRILSVDSPIPSAARGGYGGARSAAEVAPEASAALVDQNERLKVMVQALEMQKKSSEAEFAASTFQLRAAQAEIESLQAQRRKVSVMMKAMGSDTVAYVKQQQAELEEARSRLAELGTAHSALREEHHTTSQTLSEHREQLDELKTHSTHMSERLLRETVTAKRESDRDMRASYMEMVKAARLAVAAQQLSSRKELATLAAKLDDKTQDAALQQQAQARQIEMLLEQLRRDGPGNGGGGSAASAAGSGDADALREMLRQRDAGARNAEQMHQQEREQAVLQTLKLRDHIDQLSQGVQEMRDETTNVVRDLLARLRQNRPPATAREVDEQLQSFNAMWDRTVGGIGSAPAFAAAPAAQPQPSPPASPEASAAIALSMQRMYRGKQGSEVAAELVKETAAARSLQRVARGRRARKETGDALVRAREERASLAIGPGPRAALGKNLRFEKVLTDERSVKLGMSIALDPDFDLPRISGVRSGGALQRATGQDVAVGDLVELVGGEPLYGLSCSEIKLKLDQQARPTVLTLIRLAVEASIEGDFFEMVVERRPGEKLGISLGSSSSNDTVIAAIRSGAVMRLYGATVAEGDIVATINGEDVREMSLDEIHARVLKAPRPLRIGCYSQQRTGAEG